MDKENIVFSIILLLSVLAVMLFSFGTFTGVMAAENISTGNVSVSITAVTEINFTTSTLDFGTGSVTGSAAELTSSAACTANDTTNWSGGGSCGELILENIGSEDVELNITSQVNATSMIGGTNPSFQWNMSDVQDDSCTGTPNISYIFNSDNWLDVNITSEVDASFCSNFDATDSSDSIKIDFRLVIPADTIRTGSTSAIITATGRSS